MKVLVKACVANERIEEAVFLYELWITFS